MNKLLAIVAVVVALATGQAMAQETAKLFGLGGKPGGCGQWASGDDGTLYSSWLMGYLSAVNSWAKRDQPVDVSRGVPGMSMLMWMKDWCRNHPLDQVASSALALIAEIGNHAQADRTPTLEAGPRTIPPGRTTRQ